MDVNKLLGIALVVVGLFDMLVLPRLVPTLPDTVRSVVWVLGVVLCALGALLLVGSVRMTG